ncbi:hypothetical protein EMCRGX_G026821 [Ephydatia muelleri]|eukprot:Em0014g683a
MATSPTKVQFDDCVWEPKNKHKAQPPTQRYDRKEIQKRLDVENWMDEQLRILFDCEDEFSDNMPELDIDDVLMIEESQRASKLKEYLKDAKKPVDTFIRQLVEKAHDIKPVPTSDY